MLCCSIRNKKSKSCGKVREEIRSKKRMEYIKTKTIFAMFVWVRVYSGFRKLLNATHFFCGVFAASLINKVLSKN